MVWEVLQSLVLPDPWQQAAIEALARGQDVIVDAPTGSGKTFIFEKFFDGRRLSGQAIFTVPTRALANDKFAEWRAAGRPVGILTGDVSFRAQAPLLVATLEAVQWVLQAGVPKPSVLVVDEYQWLGDQMRGNHYEGVLMSLPLECRLLLLSGSVGNPEAVERWLKKLGRSVCCVRQHQRPVPLEEVNLDSLLNRVPRSVEGYWVRRLTGALREGLGPILVFCPHRLEAEKLARQLAQNLPPGPPLTLTEAQQDGLQPSLARCLSQARVGWHHSGLSYHERAGVVEPLAKAGQLRVVVATLGLSAGINFSLRSVLVTTGQYSVAGVPRMIEPHELLQMAGRAGRRGLDEKGYFLVAHGTPRLGQARAQRLRRAGPLPWATLLRRLAHHSVSIHQAADDFVAGLFLEEPMVTGTERTRSVEQGVLPCGQTTDTGRARLVRRKRRPYRGCKRCEWRAQCLELDPAPTLLWQWQRLGLLDRNLQLTHRGRVAARFLGPEGLAVAAALEVKHYPPREILFDCANLFASTRFCGAESRWAGRLAQVCRQVFGPVDIPGWLERGVPPGYGAGADEVLRHLHEKSRRVGQLTTEWAGRGDVDRLVIEWTSFLRGIVHGQNTGVPEVELPGWRDLQNEAQQLIASQPPRLPPEIPPLSPEQQRPIEKRFR